MGQGDWRCRAEHPSRSSIFSVGFFFDEGFSNSRKNQIAISNRPFQYSESSELLSAGWWNLHGRNRGDSDIESGMHTESEFWPRWRYSRRRKREPDRNGHCAPGANLAEVDLL